MTYLCNVGKPFREWLSSLYPSALFAAGSMLPLHCWREKVTFGRPTDSTRCGIAQHAKEQRTKSAFYFAAECPTHSLLLEENDMEGRNLSVSRRREEPAGRPAEGPARRHAKAFILVWQPLSLAAVEFLRQMLGSL